MIAMGCSNDAPTTAPNSPETFIVPGDGASLKRFGAPDESPVITDTRPILVTLRGHFIRESTGCIMLSVDKNVIVELFRESGFPADIPYGAYVEVLGHFAARPVSRCQLLKQFEVMNIAIIQGDHTDQ